MPYNRELHEFFIVPGITVVLKTDKCKGAEHTVCSTDSEIQREFRIIIQKIKEE
jgi:hypothetical protein